MGRKLICDVCGNEIVKQMGIRKLEIEKISPKDYDNYPNDFSSSTLVELDLCIKCSQSIEKEIQRLKNIGSRDL